VFIRIRTHLLHVSTIALLAAAGCGGTSDQPSTQRCVAATDVTADLPAEPGGTAIAVAAADDRFEPACVEIAGPGALRLVVRNDGGHPHNLTLPDGSSIAVDAGQVAILDTTVAAGRLQFTCTIHPGMDGELRVATG
jgi:plastocyanin